MGKRRESVRIGLALALVGGDVVQATEHLESRVSLNAMLLAKIGLFCAVDLYELDILLLERRGSLLVLRREALAVAAPGGIDCAENDCQNCVLEAIKKHWAQLTLGQDNVVLLDETIKVVCLELDNIRGRGNRSGSQQAENKVFGGMHFDPRASSRDPSCQWFC
jgi:hypothetical protein